MAKDMEDQKCDCDCHDEHMHKMWFKRGRGWHKGEGEMYFFGIIGALLYFLPHAATFSEAIVGIIKSIGWPAVLVFKALELLRV